MRRIAFLGTGIMGVQMARRLAQAKFEVAAWNRSMAKAHPLAAHGALICEHPSQALTGADAAIVMLSTGEIVDEVLFGKDRQGQVPAETLRRGAIVAVTSTIEVATARAQARRLEALGVAYVDAPVSGGEVGARDGRLVILAGGPQETVEALRPVFAPLGRLTRMGEVGTGQLAKLANQIITGGTLAAIAEAMHFAKSTGVDPAALREAMQGGFADSRILDIHGQRMVERNFVPGSPAEQQLGALLSARELAASLRLDLSLLDTVTQIFGDFVTHEGKEIDVSGVLTAIERRSRG